MTPETPATSMSSMTAETAETAETKETTETPKTFPGDDKISDDEADECSIFKNLGWPSKNTSCDLGAR
jgi:hypothetical protein